MALPDFTINDDHSVATLFTRRYSGPDGSEFIDTTRTGTATPRLFRFKRSVFGTAKSVDGISDRILIQLSDRRVNAVTGVYGTVIENVTLSVPRALGIANADIYDTTTLMKNFMAGSASSVFYLERLLRGEF
jgi:hypothetical protein